MRAHAHVHYVSVLLGLGVLLCPVHAAAQSSASDLLGRMAYAPIAKPVPEHGLVPYTGPVMPLGKKYELRPSVESALIEPNGSELDPLGERPPFRLEPPHEAQEYAVHVFERDSGLLAAIAAVRRDYFTRPPSPDFGRKGGWLANRHIGTKVSGTLKFHF